MSGARRLRILGSRGIPNRHGGFESCAQHLAPWLVERGWDVTVYCQEPPGTQRRQGTWRGVRLEHVPAPWEGARGSVWFDAWCARHAARHDDLLLTLGFNTAVLFPWYRLRGRRHVVNMDGVEWRRGKWPRPVRAWFWGNSWIAGYGATHLIADHPDIEAMLARRGWGRRVTMVPYGADRLDTAPVDPLRAWRLSPRGYGLVIARPEPENSLLEIVRAWSSTPRAYPLVVLGAYEAGHPYHVAVRAAAGPDVIFPGAIYDTAIVQVLRHHARLYVHGHTVGGTNPSLVEALGAGSPVLAHDNTFNRWVAGPGARFFRDEPSCAAALAALLDDDAALEAMRAASHARHAEAFTWERVLPAYEAVLLSAI
ncbi:glycosyltransferase [Luteitalea sp.]|jgi:glycosyltransferase involved in cell wall biosynthesis|uniref:glycosyltransferase n=1 Tax=Luteitalea sp. TaxID=2004800 RepID=UPI0037C6E61D